MPIKEENTRTTITLSKELDEKIDKLANLQNVSRNAVIVNLIQMSIDAQISIWNKLKDPDFVSNMISIASMMDNEEIKKQMIELKDAFNSKDEKTQEAISKIQDVFEKMK